MAEIILINQDSDGTRFLTDGLNTVFDEIVDEMGNLGAITVDVDRLRTGGEGKMQGAMQGALQNTKDLLDG